MSEEAPTILESMEGQVLTLVARGGSLDGRFYTAFGATLTVGRSPSCALAIPLARMSGEQARVELHGGLFWISALSARSHTVLNGSPLNDSAPLVNGDRLRMGRRRPEPATPL